MGKGCGKHKKCAEYCPGVKASQEFFVSGYGCRRKCCSSSSSSSSCSSSSSEQCCVKPYIPLSTVYGSCCTGTAVQVQCCTSKTRCKSKCKKRYLKKKCQPKPLLTCFTCHKNPCGCGKVRGGLAAWNPYFCQKKH